MLGNREAGGGEATACPLPRGLVCVRLHHMTVRITVSLPDDSHATLVRLAEASDVSASAVVRMILADVLPKMASVLDFLGTVTPETAGKTAQELDVWAAQMRTLMHQGPESLGDFRGVLDDPPGQGDEG